MDSMLKIGFIIKMLSVFLFRTFASTVANVTWLALIPDIKQSLLIHTIIVPMSLTIVPVVHYACPFVQLSIA